MIRPPKALREAMILATCALHPGLIARFESALERLDLPDPKITSACAIAC